MKAAKRGFWRDRKGATAVEFSMVALPFVLLVFGTIEFGRALWARETLHAVAIAGARCMGLVQTGCGTSGTYSSSMATTYVQSVASSWGMSLPSSGITVSNSATCAGVTGFSQVTLSYAFQTAVPTLIAPLVGGLPLTASSCFPNQT